MIERLFELGKHQSSVGRELLAGCTTFMTMAYILFVQPAMLSNDFAGNPTGLHADAVLLATCVSAAVASLLMGIYARLPIALAPGMGQNAVFVGVIMSLGAAGHAEPARAALGMVAVSGVAFLALSLLGVRELLLNTLSDSLRNSIAIGIGLFIALIGFKNGEILIDDAATLVALNADGPRAASWAVFWTGFVVAGGLHVRRVPGAILLGIVSATVVALLLGEVTWPGQATGLPQHNAVFQMDLTAAFRWQAIPVILLFLYMDIFDTMGTLVGVTESAGLSENGRLPRAKQAMLCDATGTLFGACMGTSTVTSYIESAAGVQQGGRTGLTAVTTGILFLLVLPVSPLIASVGSYAPITAPALVIVGALMFQNIGKIDWSDATEALPAFLVIAGIPFFFSIADGIALGLICYPVLKLLAGRGREVHPFLTATAVVLVAYLVLR